MVDVTILDEGNKRRAVDATLRAARPDDDRITGDRQAAAGLAAASVGLPLALQIIAAIMDADPPLATAELADELAAETQRLERLAYGTSRHRHCRSRRRLICAGKRISILLYVLAISQGPVLMLA